LRGVGDDSPAECGSAQESDAEKSLRSLRDTSKGTTRERSVVCQAQAATSDVEPPKWTVRSGDAVRRTDTNVDCSPTDEYVRITHYLATFGTDDVTAS
jgi:hypothetical protein